MGHCACFGFRKRKPKDEEDRGVAERNKPECSYGWFFFFEIITSIDFFFSPFDFLIIKYDYGMMVLILFLGFSWVLFDW